MKSSFFSLACAPLFLASAACSSSSGSDVVNDAGPSSDASSNANDATANVDASSMIDSSTSIDGASASDGGSCPRAPTSGLATGTGTASGMLFGRTQTIVDVDARIARPGNVGTWELWVELGDFANACGYDTARLDKQNSTSAVIVIQSTSTGATSPFTATTYTAQGLGQTDAGSFSYNISVISNTSDAQCKGSASRGSASGTITLTTAGPTRVVGSYDLTLGSSGHLTGTFDAPVCNPADPLEPVCCVP